MRTTVQREDSSKPIGFSPQSQTAQVGDKMFWFNDDRHTQHQIHCSSPVAAEWCGVIEPQNPSSLVNLDAAGTYQYHCSIHPDETGTITVS